MVSSWSNLSLFIDVLTFHLGLDLILRLQNMWAEMKVVKKKGLAQLCFDKNSKNNPSGPARYGFLIMLDQQHNFNKERNLARAIGMQGGIRAQ